jgi:hypothetical protein
MRKFFTNGSWILLIATVGVWTVLVALFSPALPQTSRNPVGAIFGLVFLATLIPWRGLKAARLLALFFIGVGVWLWSGLVPSNQRNWTPDVKAVPHAEVNGNEVTIHNVRNFRYRTENDFDQNYETRVVNLNELSEVDIVAVYWGSKAIAHIMVSFGFQNGTFLAFSIETRKEQGEAYSAINGFFRNYELAYVVADERDVIALRTTYRAPTEDVYVLRTRIALENGRKLFGEYVRRINDLREHPKFYNTLTTNCTTTVLQQIQAVGAYGTYSWKILLSGYVPEYLFDTGTLMPGLSLDEIMSSSRVNERSMSVPLDENYSNAIRVGVPRPEPRAVPLKK